jgi:hypothetical protein
MVAMVLVVVVWIKKISKEEIVNWANIIIIYLVKNFKQLILLHKNAK